MIELVAVGGYNEVGKNMTAIRINGEVIILDMGLHLENYVQCTEEEDVIKISAAQLTEAGAIPNIASIDDLRKDVKAIIPSHAHLDHVGAIPYLSNKFNAEILCTPFTAAVLRAILKDEKLTLKNRIKSLNVNAIYNISKNITVEFINMTHSTPQTVMVALHTPKGIILYANDFKFDLFPVIGKKPDFEKLRALGKKGVLALIVESTYAGLDQKTPSETVAKEMLKDVLLGTDNKGKAIIITTFSSHLARLKSIIEFGKKLNRRIVFLGRSLAKYVRAGEETGIINFSKDVEIVKFGRHIKRRLKRLMKEGKEKYLLVVTGHQGERKATLSKMVNGELPFVFDVEDHVIFSCKTIPTPTNERNRAAVERQLKKFGVRLFKDIHTSGHAAREDLRDLINLTKPKYLIPAHGSKEMRESMADLAMQMGYKLDKDLFLIKDGQRLKLQ